jgi:hypothetical protein
VWLILWDQIKLTFVTVNLFPCASFIVVRRFENETKTLLTTTRITAALNQNVIDRINLFAAKSVKFWLKYYRNYTTVYIFDSAMMSSFDYVVWTIVTTDFDYFFARIYIYMYSNKISIHFCENIAIESLRFDTLDLTITYKKFATIT